MINVVPINVAEERMTHDLLSISRPTTQAKLWFPSEKLLKNGNGVARHMNRIQRLISQDGIINLIFVLSTERGLLQ